MLPITSTPLQQCPATHQHQSKFHRGDELKQNEQNSNGSNHWVALRLMRRLLFLHQVPTVICRYFVDFIPFTEIPTKLLSISLNDATNETSSPAAREEFNKAFKALLSVVLFVDALMLTRFILFDFLSFTFYKFTTGKKGLPEVRKRKANKTVVARLLLMSK